MPAASRPSSQAVVAAGKGRRGREVRREADVLLVAEGRNLDRRRKPCALFAQRLDGDDTEDDAEGSVEAAGIDDAVDMRADQDRRRCGVPSREAADDAARRVDPGLESGLPHQPERRLRRLPVGR